MPDSYIQIPPDSYGKKLRAFERNYNGTDWVHTHPFVLVDEPSGEPVDTLVGAQSQRALYTIPVTPKNRTLFDFGSRTDGNPVYAAYAPMGTAQTATGWTVFKLAYDSRGRANDIQVAEGAWTDRATLAWDA